MPSTSKSSLPFTLALVLAAAALAGCAGPTGGESSLFVKDAPTDELREVHVTFTKAQVQSADGSWRTVFDGKEAIELLALSDAAAREKLASFDLPDGHYEGLRIFVSEVRVVALDGSESHLNVFGNIVQVAASFTVGPDGIDILIDFDLDAGLDLQGGTFTPVVGDIQTSDDDSDRDGEDDVEDADDDNDDVDDGEDEDDDGDEEDDAPDQETFEDVQEACASEIQEERDEAAQERDEALAEARAERDAALNDANSTPEQRDAANATYAEQAAEIEADYEGEIAEADEEEGDCAREEDDEDDDEEEDEEDDEEGDGEEDDEGEEEDGEAEDD